MRHETKISFAEQTAETLGVPLPKPLLAAFAQADRWVAAAEAARPTPAQVATAFCDAVDAGHDDPAAEVAGVLALLNAGGSVESMVRERATLHVGEALTAQRPAVLKTWAKVVTDCSKIMHRAHKVLGGLRLDDSDAVLKLGPDAATAWGEARAAEAKVLAAVQGCKVVFDMRRPDLRLTLARPSLAQFEALPADAGPWQLVQAGLDLDLVDPDDHDRHADLNAEREARDFEQSPNEAARRAFREASPMAGAAEPLRADLAERMAKRAERVDA